MLSFLSKIQIPLNNILSKNGMNFYCNTSLENLIAKLYQKKKLEIFCHISKDFFMFYEFDASWIQLYKGAASTTVSSNQQSQM